MDIQFILRYLITKPIFLTFEILNAHIQHISQFWYLL